MSAMHLLYLWDPSAANMLTIFLQILTMGKEWCNCPCNILHGQLHHSFPIVRICKKIVSIFAADGSHKYSKCIALMHISYDECISQKWYNHV